MGAKEAKDEFRTPEQMGKLKQVPIFLVFATGFRSGLAKIEARLRELTGNPNVNGLIIDPADLSVAAKINTIQQSFLFHNPPSLHN